MPTRVILWLYRSWYGFDQTSSEWNCYYERCTICHLGESRIRQWRHWLVRCCRGQWLGWIQAVGHYVGRWQRPSLESSRRRACHGRLVGRSDRSQVIDSNSDKAIIWWPFLLPGEWTQPDAPGCTGLIESVQTMNPLTFSADIEIFNEVRLSRYRSIVSVNDICQMHPDAPVWLSLSRQWIHWPSQPTLIFAWIDCIGQSALGVTRVAIKYFYSTFTLRYISSVYNADQSDIITLSKLIKLW